MSEKEFIELANIAESLRVIAATLGDIALSQGVYPSGLTPYQEAYFKEYKQ